ncbi:nucleoporin NDC1-like [Acanthaster planci]|uniref:Nucleoporin NDC1-like n=1 Tax=Acanthaster planci TaxID=133434 RepID=A0A8B7ZYC6_ACAPL|nr:nucleoporin NDC1-like [Acanthaster planci]
MEKMITNRNWYMRDVFRWRTGASLAWSVILLPGTAGLFVLLVKISIFHPHLWFRDWLVTALSISSVGYILLIAVLTSLVAISNVLFYTVVPVVQLNRLSVLWGVVKPSNLLHMACHTLAGGVTAWCWSFLIGPPYSTLTVLSSDGSKQHLNENHLFLVLHGAYVGLLHSFWLMHTQAHRIEFPIIQQLKFFQVRTFLQESIYANLIFSGRATGYFYLLYYLFGSIPKHWLLVNLNLQESPTPLNAISGLLNLTLLWNVVLTGFITSHLWCMSLHLFKVFNTEVYQFPIEVPLSSQEECCLHKALTEKHCALVQYLAYLDLSMLAECGRDRRKQVFALSQPGGHPHNWTNISTACLSLIDSLTQRLTAHQEWVSNGLARQRRSQDDAPRDRGTLVTNGRAAAQEDSATLWYTPQEPRRPYLRSSVASPITPVTGTDPVFSPVLETPQVPGTGRVHNVTAPPKESTWCATPGSGYNPLTGQPIHRDQRKSSQSSREYPGLGMWSWQHRLDIFKRWRLGAYLLNPFPEAVSRALFMDVQLHIWALEALSSLVAASYHEDTYGVVQGTLPDILVGMLGLQSAVEKHFKLPTSVPKRSPSDFRPVRLGPVHPDDRLRLDLKSTVTTSLHRIVATFGPHLKSVQMAPEYQQKLEQLMEYKQ